MGNRLSQWLILLVIVTIPVLARQECLLHSPTGEPHLEYMLGQLLFVNADGFSSKNNAIDPEYVQLVKDHHIGGVLPHFQDSDFLAARQAIARLQAAASAPLLLGIDYDQFRSPIRGIPLTFGLGYGDGLLGRYGFTISDSCLEMIVHLEALLHKALGLNLALGPTIDRSRQGFLAQESHLVAHKAQIFLQALSQQGLLILLKHFPYRPDDYNVHHSQSSFLADWKQIQNRIPVFSDLHCHADMIMTTHLLHPGLDEQIVTFSEPWLNILRQQIGFEGLIITDALLMIRRYDRVCAQLLQLWDRFAQPVPVTLDTAFAALSLLAGHDMVILEGTASDSRHTYQALLALAKAEDELGRRLRDRIKTAYQRVWAFKKARSSHFRSASQITPEQIEQVSALLTELREHRCHAGNERHPVFQEQLNRLRNALLTKSEK